MRVTALEVMFDIIHCFGLDIIKGDSPVLSRCSDDEANDERDSSSQDVIPETPLDSESDVQPTSTPSEAAAKLVAILSAFLDSDVRTTSFIIC